MQEKLKKLILYGDYAALIVVSLSSLGVLIAFFFMIKPNQHRITLHLITTHEVIADSIKGNDSSAINSKAIYLVKPSIDSINLHLKDQLAQEFKLNVRDNNPHSYREDVTKYALAFISLIFALAGFFGFKSIKEMQLAAIEAAKEQAKQSLSDSQEEFKKNIYSEMILEINKLAIKINKANADELHALKKRIDDCCGAKEDNSKLKGDHPFDQENSKFQGGLFS